MGSSIILVLVTNPGPAVEVCSSHCQSVDPRCTPLLCSVYWLPLATPKPRPFLHPLHPWNVAASSARPTAGTGEAERKGARETKIKKDGVTDKMQWKQKKTIIL